MRTSVATVTAPTAVSLLSRQALTVFDNRRLAAAALGSARRLRDTPTPPSPWIPQN
jgi:hypothetical protein